MFLFLMMLKKINGDHFLIKTNDDRDTGEDYAGAAVTMPGCQPRNYFEGVEVACTRGLQI